MEHIIYCFWTGTNPMSPQRKRCFDTMNKSGCKVVLVTPANLSEFIKPEYPLHPAYDYLSLTHKSDYLRCYFMHHHGGGYSDIKEIIAPWNSAFDDMKDGNIYVNGYQEISPKGVARVKDRVLYNELKRNYRRLVGMGSIICIPYSPFTTEWIDMVHQRLDELYIELKEHPSVHPQEVLNMVFNPNQLMLFRLVNTILEKFRLIDQNRSKYPLSWSDILGDIFHPLCFKYYTHIRQTVPKPLFMMYR